LRQEKTYHSTSNEENGDGNMLHVLSAPLATSATQMFHEDVGRAVKENEKALYKFSRRSPFRAGSLGPHIPSPSELGKCTTPAAEGQETKPKEDAAFDPVRQSTEDVASLLINLVKQGFLHL
jgi:hypothetical protein